MAAQFIWYELATNDADAAANFYGTVVGWTAQDSGMPNTDYRLWSINEAPVGGLMTIPPEAAASGMRPTWLGYLHVPDVDTCIAEVTAAGGKLVMPGTDFPGVGRIGMVTDPQGAAFYVMTPTGTEPSPSFAPGKPGHGGWHELHTTDWQAAFAFYSQHFGWAKSDEMDMGPMGKYLLFNTGGDAIGGMFKNPQAQRPHWLYYFNVEDINAAKTRVENAGGTILNGPHEVPGGSWIVQASDPQGVMFALVSPPKS